jgi:hypothetical protein
MLIIAVLRAKGSLIYARFKPNFIRIDILRHLYRPQKHHPTISLGSRSACNTPHAIYKNKAALLSSVLRGYNAMYSAEIQRDVSIEHTASIFKVKEGSKQETNTKRATSANTWM